MQPTRSLSRFRSLVSGASVFLLAAQGALFAALLGYEPFDGPAGQAHVRTDEYLGRTGFFPPVKTLTRTPLTLTDQPLEYRDPSGTKLASAGNSAVAPAGESYMYRIDLSDTRGAIASLRHPQNPAVLGAPGRSLWFSFLVSFDGEITRETVAHVKVGANTIPVGLVNNGRSDAAYFRLGSLSSGIVPVAGRAMLVLGRVDFGPKDTAAARTDSIRIWIDPAIRAPAASDVGDLALTGVSIPFEAFWTQSDKAGNLRLDELRLGETAADVLPVGR